MTNVWRRVHPCARAGCVGPALASWWQLCAGCTAPLLSQRRGPDAQADEAGWAALAWAEQIAPTSWGNAQDDDPWVLSFRCLAFAAGVAGLAAGCQHTDDAGSNVPVVAVPRIAGLLQCPACAEPTIEQAGNEGTSCDRCRTAPSTELRRCAFVTGSSLIVVAKLCSDCRATVLPMTAITEPSPS